MAIKRNSEKQNQLYYGDNLDVLRQNLKDESIDLIYLDPPFNSNRSYSVLFEEKSGDEAQAQIEAFDDTWTWSQESETVYAELLKGTAPNKVKDALEAMRKLLGDNDLLAYLVMMTQRLIELRRVLKPTGSLYLHCDPTASHYLKIILDSIFGKENFRNEIVWHYKTFHGRTKTYWPKKHDTILFYTKSDKWTFEQLFETDLEETIDFNRWSNYIQDGNKILGNLMPTQDTRFTRYLRRWVRENGRDPGPDDVVLEIKGQAMDTVWDIKAVDPKDRDRLGYPTQKPVALLERILRASSKPGDLVLDPFCGCGTTVAAAQDLGRRWIGIDITTLAIDLIDARLRHTYGESVTDNYDILGIPRDMEGAEALFHRSPFEFERWCVMMIDGQPNEKQVGDRGIDGVIRFPIDAKSNSAKALVSVKGGAINPGYLRDLVGVVESEREAMGIFICLREPTRGIIEAANHSGIYTHPATGTRYPKVQILTVQEILDGKRPNMPQSMLPYFQAERKPGKPGEKLF